MQIFLSKINTKFKNKIIFLQFFYLNIHNYLLKSNMYITNIKF